MADVHRYFRFCYTILVFYFRFWFRPKYIRRHAIVHRPAKFRPKSNHSQRRYDVKSIFQDGDHRIRNLLPGSDLVTASVLEGGNVFVYQILMIYRNSRLRENNKLSSRKETVQLLHNIEIRVLH